MMAGGVYCPLSCRESRHGLNVLVQRTHTRLVLVHWSTKTNFNDDMILLNIDSILINSDMNNDIDSDRLSSFVISPDNIAYIIFTSDITETFKVVNGLLPISLIVLMFLCSGSNSTL